MSKFRFAEVALALALIAAACGGDDAADSTTTTVAPTTTTTAPTTTTTTTTIAPTTTTEAPLPNLVELAISAGQFNTLIELAQLSGLDALLVQPGTFTVFAPTDDAFAALPEGLLDSIKADADAATIIAGLLTYHAAAVELTFSQVEAATSISTASGLQLAVAVDADGNVVINDVAKIIQPDLKASNGIVHVIDAVLIPPGLLD